MAGTTIQAHRQLALKFKGEPVFWCAPALQLPTTWKDNDRLPSGRAPRGVGIAVYPPRLVRVCRRTCRRPPGGPTRESAE